MEEKNESDIAKAIDEEVADASQDFAKGSIEKDKSDSSDIDPDDKEQVAKSDKSFTFALGKRLAGLIAFLLGTLGFIISLALVFIIARVGLSATSTTDQLLQPVGDSIDRIETRIDQADDLINDNRIDDTTKPEFQARAEGISDVSNSATQVFSSVENHPLYQWLPVNFDSLSESIERFSGGSQKIFDISGKKMISTADAEVAASEINMLQAEVNNANKALTKTSKSFKRWIRIATFVGVLLSLWSCWAQLSLAKQGIRSLRGK